MLDLRQLNREAIRWKERWKLKSQWKCIVYRRRQKMEETMYKDIRLYIIPNEPPYTERYVRWCERTLNKIIIQLLLDFIDFFDILYSNYLYIV